MNCENYQILLSDFVDGALPAADCTRLELHLNSCPDCKDARNDLSVIVDFCREQRGVYDPVPNSQAMWLRISNLIEAEGRSPSHEQIHRQAGWFYVTRRAAFQCILTTQTTQSVCHRWENSWRSKVALFLEISCPSLQLVK